MQEYLQKTQFGALMDEAGVYLLLLTVSLGGFTLLWGLRPMALLAGLALLVGLVLRHHIGGFLRTVEREAQERRDLEARDGVDGDRPE